MEPCEKKEYGTGKNMQRLTFTPRFCCEWMFSFSFFKWCENHRERLSSGILPRETRKVGKKVILGTLVPGEFLLVWCGFIRSC
jgi:hypothetical protein